MRRLLVQLYRFLVLVLVKNTTTRRLALALVAAVVAGIALSADGGGASTDVIVVYPCEPSWWTIFFGCW